MKAQDRIDTLLANWDGPNPQPRPEINGFIGWAWDSRREILAALESGDLDQLTMDICYTMQQAEDEVSYRQAKIWLKTNSHWLIEALRESLGMDND